jgi:hypothetical protein
VPVAHELISQLASGNLPGEPLDLEELKREEPEVYKRLMERQKSMVIAVKKSGIIDSVKKATEDAKKKYGKKKFS